MNPLLYGHDEEASLVGLHLVAGDTFRLYSRTAQDNVVHRDVPFTPFAFFTDRGFERLEESVRGTKHWTLKGDHDYRHLVTFTDWGHFWDGVKSVKDADDMRNEVFYIPSPEDQYLMQTGKTLYLGMTEQDVKRMQVDIEVYSSTGAFPLVERDGDCIFIISLTTNRGWEKILRLSNDKATPRSGEEVFDSEADLLRGFIREIHRQDPDILELHNGFGFDLPYIEGRCALHGIELSIGRDNRSPRTWSSQAKFAEKDIAYTNYLVGGRSVVDTMFFAMGYDVFARELPNYRLKDVADYLRRQDGITFGQMYGRERSYVEGDRISDLWDTDPDGLIDYALDDVRETMYLADKFAGATFYLSQMVPMTYQETHLAGSGRPIQSIMVRNYLHAAQSMPKPETGVQEWGGYTDIFYRGRFENVVYADVASLYPSIMLNYECHPESDILGIHRSMLSQLTDLRLSVKAAAKAAAKRGDKAVASSLKAKEQAFKIIINSCYGVMGDKFSLFNDFSEADRVCSTGQALLKQMIGIIEGDFGGTVIECDTDGVLYVAREEIHGDLEAQAKEVALISEKMPDGINIDLEGLFEVLLSYRKKNYALRDYDGKVKTKGGAFKNRGIEAFGRSYQADILNALFDGDVQQMHEIHESWKARVVAGDWTVEDFATKKSLKESVATYLEKVEDGGNRMAQYEIAITEGERTGRKPLKGDAVRYFIGGSKKVYKVTGFLDGLPAHLWKPGLENTRFYLDRLQKFASRFETFIPESAFPLVFSKHVELSGTADLFGGSNAPDLSGVKVLQVRVAGAV